MPIIIFLLSVLSVVFFISLLWLKKEIRSIRNQLQEHLRGVEKPIDISLIDKDLTELAAEINRSQTFQKEQQLSIFKQERHLKEAVSNISHDLRTPLTSMAGHLQLLQKTDLKEEQREYLEISLARGRDLKTLIDDFYDISVIEDKEPILTRINLDSVLADAVLSFTEQLKQKNITPAILFLKTPAYVLADEGMLKRVMMNLVSNAVSYGRKELKIEIQERALTEVKFTNAVEDETGFDVNRIFDRFYTADSARSQSGSGLGLYIVKMLAGKMGGDVSAAFEAGELVITLSLRREVS